MLAALFLVGCGVDWSKPLFSSRTRVIEERPKGEAEFLAQNYAAAAPLIDQAAAKGNLRAIFYRRLLSQRGLDGGPLKLYLAQKDLNYLSSRYQDLLRLEKDSPAEERPLYQTALATLNFLGLNPEKKADLSKALDLATLAAEAGFIPAMNLLSALTLTAAQDPNAGFFVGGEKACFDWAQKGADLNDPVALSNLAALYRQGLGSDQNAYYAASLTHAAATGKWPMARAQNDLGYYYETGFGVTKDLVEATRWYGLAAKRGYPLALTNLERLKKKTKGPAKSAVEMEY
ncbi:MAG: sel1 repeat family protein [Deltaproteobacteria bacterium]|nr:sel1 repeat family protein [Deltaproteobacteria bacterium]